MVQLVGAVTAFQVSVVPVLVVPEAARPVGVLGEAVQPDGVVTVTVPDGPAPSPSTAYTVKAYVLLGDRAEKV